MLLSSVATLSPSRSVARFAEVSPLRLPLALRLDAPPLALRDAPPLALRASAECRGEAGAEVLIVDGGGLDDAGRSLEAHQRFRATLGHQRLQVIVEVCECLCVGKDSSQMGFFARSHSRHPRNGYISAARSRHAPRTRPNSAVLLPHPAG